jgi:hypothetical protein
MSVEVLSNVSDKASVTLTSQLHERIPVDESFGNLLLVGLEEINLPEPLSFWPLAPGWKYLAVFLSIVGIYCLFKTAQRWQKNGYRREGLAQLAEIEISLKDDLRLYRLAYLIKAIALQLYPRTDIAALTGASWFAYLNKMSAEAYFDRRCIELLGSSRYSASAADLSQDDFNYLVLKIRCWIEQHTMPDVNKLTKNNFLDNKKEVANV